MLQYFIHPFLSVDKIFQVSNFANIYFMATKKD